MLIQDRSNDKGYFTIIPNYILNHSSIYDREVYIQMKRVAGEKGECWKSQKNLADQSGISVNRLKKSIAYLIEHNWIKEIGTKKSKTSGGKQKTKIYMVVDLWDLNNTFYKKGVSPNDIPKAKGVSPDDTKGYHEKTKGVSPESYKEEPLKKNLNNNILFEKFFDLYDKKADKKRAFKLWDKLPEKTKLKIIQKTPNYVLAHPNKQYRKNPSTFLYNECWEDELPEVPIEKKQKPNILSY